MNNKIIHCQECHINLATKIDRYGEYLCNKCVTEETTPFKNPISKRLRNIGNEYIELGVRYNKEYFCIGCLNLKHKKFIGLLQQALKQNLSTELNDTYIDSNGENVELRFIFWQGRPDLVIPKSRLLSWLKLSKKVSEC